MTTWVEIVVEHEQVLFAVASLTGIAAMALAFALMLVRRGGRGPNRSSDPQPRR
jgi:hypothetical protein